MCRPQPFLPCESGRTDLNDSIAVEDPGCVPVRSNATGITSAEVPRSYRVYEPQTGKETDTGRLPDKVPAQFNSRTSGAPRVVVVAADSVRAP